MELLAIVFTDYLLFIWLALLIIFLIIEAFTFELTSVWFGLGSLCAMISSILTSNIYIQILVFTVISLSTLILLKPVAKKFLIKKKVETNINMIVGKQSTVIQKIDENDGAIKIDGKVWTAKNIEDEVIEVGTKVEIIEIKGSKVIVKKI